MREMDNVTKGHHQHQTPTANSSHSGMRGKERMPQMMAQPPHPLMQAQGPMSGPLPVWDDHLPPVVGQPVPEASFSGHRQVLDDVSLSC